jgi:NADH-quinone oxidoreductase subunit N
MLFLPELVVLAIALGLFVVTVGVGGSPANVQETTDERRAREARAAKASDTVALLGSLALLVAAIASIHQAGPLFFGAYDVGLFSQLSKVLLAGALLIGVWLVRGTETLPTRDRPEFQLFMTLATFGMMMLVSSTELVTFYVGLELAAYSLYILVPLARGFGNHNEAAFKYFLYGAALSAVSLFGMSILFGLAGTTNIADIGVSVAANPQPAAVIAVVLSLGGVFFKLAVFPFHFWAPDVYEAASDPATAFIAGASKAGAVLALLRLLGLGVGLESMHWILGGLAIASMTYGNLAALAQTDLKRLIAYSGVAQAGYILLGLIGRDDAGYAAAAYYALVYVGMIGLVFFVIVEVGKQRRDASHAMPISSLNGLHQRSPWLAALLLVGVLGLAGVPPTGGFTGKWLLFKAALDNGGFWLVLIAGINNTIGAYYYLTVLKAAYMDEAGDRPAITLGRGLAPVGLVVALATIAIGVFPQWVMPSIKEAMTGLL